MNEAREQADFKRALERLIHNFIETMTPQASLPYLGAVDLDPLEHTTRTGFIDSFLTALGWKLKKFGADVLEEARIKVETTLFLDYLGVNPDTRAPQLIVEAKAWSKPMVAASKVAAAKMGASTGYTPVTLIASAIEHCKIGGSVDTSPVTAEWAHWIARLRDYVLGAYQNSGHIVSRAVITSGQWMVVFTDPENAFIRSGDVNSDSIVVFLLSQYVEQSTGIYDLLSFGRLVQRPPDCITTSRLRAYLAPGSVKSVHRALWLRRQDSGAHFRIQPQLLLYAAAVLTRTDDVLITVIDDQSENAVPHEIEQFAVHRAAVDAASNALLSAITDELGDLPDVSGIDVFPGFVTPPSIASVVGVVPPQLGPRSVLLKSYPARSDEFLLVTGLTAHFLLPQPTVDPCAGHDWTGCNAWGHAVGPAPIFSRSVSPASFFVSGEEYHCAHRLVHDRRDERCLVQAFEEFLCCRACVLQSVCWSATELDELPCGLTSIP